MRHRWRTDVAAIGAVVLAMAATVAVMAQESTWQTADRAVVSSPGRPDIDGQRLHPDTYCTVVGDKGLAISGRYTESEAGPDAWLRAHVVAGATVTATDAPVYVREGASLVVLQPEAVEPTPDPTPRDRRAMTYDEFQRRVYALFLCSAASDHPDLSRFQQGWGLPEEGYRGFDERYTTPMAKAGVARFHMHLPDGFYKPDGGPGIVMPFDARVDAQERGYKGAEDFAWMVKRHPGVVFLHYFGTLHDVDMQERAAAGDYSAWLYRARRSVLHTLDLPNVEYGFDAATGWPEDSPQWRLIQLLAAIKAEQGRQCLLESALRVDMPHTHGWGVIAIQSWWDKIQDNLRAGTPSYQWALPPDQYAEGARIHIMDVANGGRDQIVDDTLPRAVADVLGRGEQYTIAVRLDVWVERGLSMRDLYHATMRVMEPQGEPMVFDGLDVWAKGRPKMGTIDGLLPAHFHANNFRKYLPDDQIDPDARKWWQPNVFDEERLRFYYAPGHPTFKSDGTTRDGRNNWAWPYADVGDGPILFDPEWDDDIRRFDQQTVDATLGQMVQAVEILDDLHDGKRAIFPYNYPLQTWPTDWRDSKGARAWRRASDYVRDSGYGERLDATAPSLYWYGPQWEDETAAEIAEAYRLHPDLPCYPWMWWRRHSSAGPVETRDQLIPPDEWAAMVRFVLERADGMILFADTREWTDEDHKRLAIALEVAAQIREERAAAQ